MKAEIAPVALKYVALPTPLPAITSTSHSTIASEGMHLPCRRCLLEANPGEKLFLIGYDPFPADSITPYRGNGPIFVHAHDCRPFDGKILPETQLQRLLSLRAYDEKHMMVAAEVIEGKELESVAGGMLADEKASYINVHNAKPGCFAVRIQRA
ncbi:uncharacterized protein BDR25DRAFT_323923 [Lindgomyces ingoldianus]|uniref:Uncharacterized protein n=1 Tax=Lindgomyces ingoldianus TaxID=673940 RepID=A0ACB6R2M7_9PLEO|nr:uncharacterized protein BDR25DRAFT_323923 [Lindgomyces ingoldianus]KAF2473355.1 hypothetical protein BDR25DRAFT_323923 [Lindgomyces ingoldianus]